MTHATRTLAMLVITFFLVLPLLAGCNTDSGGGIPSTQNYDDGTVFITARQPATLVWRAPLTRVDGSKLFPGEISGYRLYFRKRGDQRFTHRKVDDASRTRWVLEGFNPGHYEFAVSTLDTTGLESPRSETLRINITN